MLKYTVKRLVYLLPVVLGITFILFMIMSLSSGDPATLILGADASAESIVAKRKEMGLDQPILVQYFNYMLGVFKGNFGTSWVSGYDVFSVFFSKLPNTLLITTMATLVSVAIGIPMGIISSIRQYKFIDHFSMAIAMILFSVPAFWLGMMCQMLFALTLKWVPASGIGTWRHFILPSIVLGANTLALMARMSRSTMLDALRQDFVRTARSKGANEWRVIIRHVLRNGILPVITLIGIIFASNMGGAVVTETIFNIPGVGPMIINAVKSRDVPVVMGTVLFISVLVGIINLLVDLICAKIDPRIDLRSKEI